MNRDRFLTGPLRWTSKGEILATWWLSKPLPRAELSTDADRNAELHQHLWNAIAGHRFWLEGLLTWTDPATQVDAMLDGVNLARHPQWADTVEAAMDELATYSLGRRQFLLTVKLNITGRRLLGAGVKAAANDTLETFGMRPLPPTVEEYEHAMTRMRDIEHKIPTAFGARPATAAQIAWAKRHRVNPLAEPLGDPFLVSGADDQMLLETAGTIAVPYLDPSGVSELPRTGRAMAPVTRRWVKVRDDQGHESVQATVVVSKIPRRLGWPDSEFLGHIDDLGVALDFTVTGLARRKSEALAKNKRSMAQLNDQMEQISAGGDDDIQAGAMTRVVTGAKVLAAYNHDLATDDNDSLCEVEPIIMARVAADGPEGCDEQAQRIVDESRIIKWGRPVGNEINQWETAQPGGVANKELSSYRQITHSATMGATSPVVHHVLGDTSGIPLGLNTSSALQSLVLLEPFGIRETYRKKGPSMAMVADMGGGKTSMAKTFFGHMVDRGAFGIATDTTAEGEWITFAKSLDANLSVIDFRDPQSSCDPLRCLPPDLASPIATSFLITLLDVDAVSPEGRLLSEILRDDFLSSHNLSSLGEVQRYLERAADNDPLAKDLAGRMGVFSDPRSFTATSASVFDPSLPPARVDTQVMIWRFYGIQLPSELELQNAHLYRTLGVEKRLGRAAYALYAQYAKQLCFRFAHVPAIQNVDEFHHQTISPEAMAAHSTFLREGRHANAFWCAQDQLASGFRELRDLVRTRVVLRTSQPDAASEAADFLGRTVAETGQEAHDALVQKILTDTAVGNGAGVMRDNHGQIGTIQTFLPFTEERRRAADTAAQASDEDTEQKSVLR